MWRGDGDDVDDYGDDVDDYGDDVDDYGDDCDAKMATETKTRVTATAVADVQEGAKGCPSFAEGMAAQSSKPTNKARLGQTSRRRQDIGAWPDFPAAWRELALSLMLWTMMISIAVACLPLLQRYPLR